MQEDLHNRARWQGVNSDIKTFEVFVQQSFGPDVTVRSYLIGANNAGADKLKTICSGSCSPVCAAISALPPEIL